ncbi:MAG: DUF4424 family protein [Acinetobacter sp.]|nr:DUF4424 family protein [Acinetobacter sp.]
MRKWIAFTLLISMQLSANDSTGYVLTNGIEYLKSKDIQMLSEDLFISKKIIKVDYQFKNLTAKDVTETILFPLPRIDNFFDGGDFANTKKLLQTFKVNVDGKDIQPNMNVRTFIQKDENTAAIDTTELFKQCGFSETEMLNPWNRKSYEYLDSEKKLRNCKKTEMQNILKAFKDDVIPWSSQVIYSWKQTFKANSLTRVKHQYAPLVGGSVAVHLPENAKTYCTDQSFIAALKKAQLEQAPYSALGYVLKTGANWAKPIENFKLTIERDSKELFSFCWAGKVKKISPTQFQMVEKNFVPKHDLNIIFVHARDE